MQRLAIVASRVTQTNRQLIHAARARGIDAFVADAEEASTRLRAGDVAVGRLDVLPTLDGPEPGIETLRALEEQGVVVLNRAGALLGAHDKLVTALRLGANGLPIPGPRTSGRARTRASSSRWSSSLASAAGGRT